jgi:hypothetical protein
LDATTDIVLDADGGDVFFKDGGTEILRITNSSSDVIIRPVVEAIARIILFGGFMEGKWSVDVALLIAEVVFKQIMAIGIKANIQNINLFIKDQSTSKFHKQFAEFKNMRKTRQTIKAPEDKLKSFVKDIKEELKEKEAGLMAKEDK